MRHLWSLLAGIVAAPLAWLCLATGQYWMDRRTREWSTDGRFDTAELIGPALFVVAAGILLGLVGTLRWSPAGPLAAGVLLVIPTIFMFINPFDTLDAFWFEDFDQTQRLLNQDLQPWLPVENGTLLVLGALLLMAVFSAQRWRQPPTVAGPEPPAAAGAVGAGAAAPAEEVGPADEVGPAEEVGSAERAEPAPPAADAEPGGRPSGETGDEPSAEAQPPETEPTDETRKD